MGYLKAQHEIISDKSKNPVVSSEYVKHGNAWLNETINGAVSAVTNKADKSYVDTELAKKANASDLSSKADASTVAALQTTVNSKADSSTVSALSGRVSTNETNIAAANARIDEIVAIPPGSTEGNTELIDIRTGADGKKYPTAGDAVRGQVTDLKSDLIKTIQKSNFVLNDTYLNTYDISDVKQLPVNKAYSLVGVTRAKLANMPNDTTAGSETIYTGMLFIYTGFEHASYGVGYLYINNQGECFTGIDVKSGAIRWKLSATVDALNALSGLSVQKSNFVLTDNYLSTYSISSIRRLAENKIYTLSNVTRSKLADMPNDTTEGSGSVYTGVLYKFTGYDNSSFQTSYIYINNKGVMFSGIDMRSGDIRWKSYMDGSASTLYSSIDNRMASFAGKKVLILGDSIVYGSHMSDCVQSGRQVVKLSDGTIFKTNTSVKVWSKKFIDYITDVYSCTVTNNAWPGARYQDLITYYDQIVTDTYDYVIIVMGVNNWSSGGQVTTSLDALKTRFDAMGAKMMIVTPLPSSTYKHEVAQICGIIKRWGADHNIEIADLYSEFNNLNYIHGKTLSDVLLDGVHYNEDSQTDICESVKHVLKI